MPTTMQRQFILISLKGGLFFYMACMDKSASYSKDIPIISFNIYIK